MDVRGKTILVTGAGRGIGRSLATHFARKGANLALLDTNAQDIDETQTRCTELGVLARSYVADAANEDSVVGAVDQVSADFGRLDGLINNAGIVRDAMLVKVKDGQIERFVAQNANRLRSGQDDFHHEIALGQPFRQNCNVPLLIVDQKKFHRPFLLWLSIDVVSG